MKASAAAGSERGWYCLFSDHHLFVPSAGWVLSMWKFKAELKQTYFVSATSNHLPDQDSVLACFVCARPGYFIIYVCNQPKTNDRLCQFFSCLNYSDHTNTFTNNMDLPLYPHTLLISSRIFSKGGTMFIFRHFPHAAVNPWEGRLRASLNCSARYLFTLLNNPISHLWPRFFIGTVFGQANQVTVVLLF